VRDERCPQKVMLARKRLAGCNPARQGPHHPGHRRLLEVADDVNDQDDRAGQVGLHSEASKRVAGQADHGVVGARPSQK
jgi:hypothetical protein